jgi:FHA domain
MGALRHSKSGDVVLLSPEHLVGRSPLTSLVLNHPYISAHHAVVRWLGGYWELKDLGSRNGTYLNGERLQSTGSIRLELGARIAFGRPEQDWELIEIAAPAPSIRSLAEDGQEIALETDILALPSPEAPEATLFRTPDGSWRVEQSELTRVLLTGDVITVGQAQWQFTCPTEASDTATVDLPSYATTDIQHGTLHFSVSADEEHVQVQVLRHGERLDLGSRTHNYLLLILARQRLSDLAGGVEATSAGWVYREDIFTALRTDRERLNLEVFRIRRHFADAGISNSASVIERRSDTGQLRIGVARLTIERI